MTATTIRVQMAQRKDTAANWTAANPILLSGEIGYETDTKKFKIGNGSTNWNSLAYLPIPDGSGNLTITGNLEIGSTGSLTFEGSTADGFETTLAVTNPTADRTITLPNQSGTVLVSGNASIIDADIAANAEIAVSKLADGTARQLLQTDAAGTGVEWASNVDIPGTLDVTGAATFDAAVTVAGDLTVNGTTTTISTQNLLVEDKNIIIGDVATPTDVTADGGGITLKGATDKTINWVDATDAWTSSERFSVPLGTAALPSLMFTGDTNTGIYSPGADQVAISTGGSGRLFVDASGNVGVGTASPASTLHVNGTTSAYGNGAASLFWGNTFALGSLTYSGTDVIIQATGSSSGNLLFLYGGNERLRIDSSGRVGIGTSEPGAVLHSVGTNSGLPVTSGTTQTYCSLRLGGSNSTGIVDFGILGSANWIQSTDRTDLSQKYSLLLNPNGGNVGIGTTSPGQALSVAGNISSSAVGTNYVASSSQGVTTSYLITDTSGGNIQVDGAWPIRFTTNSNERARIDSSGRLLVGTSTTDDTATGARITGTEIRATNTDQVCYFNRQGSDGTIVNFNRSNVSVGTISVTTSATAYNTSSDYRLKENVAPVTDGIIRLQQLKPSRFNFIADPKTVVDGFIAHEVQTIVPEAITGEKDAVDADGNPVYQGIDQSKLVPLLTAALQEAVAKIESLETRLTASGI